MKSVSGITGLQPPTGTTAWRRPRNPEPQVTENEVRTKPVESSHPIAALQEMLQSTDHLISPSTLKCEARGLYRFFITSPDFRTDGRLDWNKVLDQIPPALQSMWWHRPSLAEALPKEPYNDITEVETALARYQEQLHVFFRASTDAHRAMRNEICSALIVIAQKGNIDARDRLAELLGPTINGLSKKWGLTDRCKLETLIRCIYMYDYRRRGGKFISYLYSSLIHQAKNLSRNTEPQASVRHDTHVAHKMLGLA